MYSAITNNIRISVFPEYDIKNSFPAENRFVFRYNITIQNLGNDAVKLHKRRWLIYDLGFGFTEVNGDGVIGEQPIIKPGEVYRYESYCPIKSDIGYMKGLYQMKRIDDQSFFEVQIPMFELITPCRLN